VAWGVMGFGDLICDVDKGRPFGMSTERLRLSRRDSRLLEEWCLDDECFSLLEECLDEECFDDEDLEDFSDGTSRMFKTRPVVGSVVESWAGSWETW